MKRKHPIAVLTAWIAMVFGANHAAIAAENNPAGVASQSGGTITGQVSNASTKSFLEGAMVAVAGTNRSVATDREGRYLLSGLAGDQVVLEVSFAGLDPQRVPVAVSAGQQIVRDVGLTADIYKMDKFTVAGVREGTARAETLQRLAPNVKNVVSSDTFGNIADGNVGDLLQHIVGITANYNGPEVFQVNIRGVGPELNSVTMDGQQVSTAQSANAGRAFEFEQASLGNIETIEVTKAPTPDMDGASIGGSVNLVTKSAFDRAAGRTFNYTIGFVTQPGYDEGYASRWQQPIKGFGPSMTFSYSDVLGPKKNIGITITGTLHTNPHGGMLITKSFERRDQPGPVFDYVVSRLDLNGATYNRAATGMKVDYRWSEKTTVSVNSFYNFFLATNDDLTHTLQTVGVATAATPQVLATVDAAGNRTGGGYIHPNYSNGITRVFAHPTLSFSNISNATVNKSGRTYLVSPMVRHRFDGMNIDYSLSYSNAATYYDTYNKKPFDSRFKGNVSLRLANVGWTSDRSRDPIWPTITQTEGPNMFLLSNYSSGGILLAQNARYGFDSVLGGKFDLKKDLRLPLPAFVKTGFTYQRQTRELWMANRQHNYVGADRTLGTADDNTALNQFLDTRGIVTTDQKKYFVDRGGMPQWPDSTAVATHRAENPQLWQENVPFAVQSRLTSRREIEEAIGAAYLMGNVRLGKVSVLAGVRMEDTRLSGEGPLNYLTPAERARRAAWVGPVTDAEAVRRVEAQFGARDTNKGHYRFYLPGVHLKYEPLPGLLTRFSWSTGVGRPPFGSIIPNTIVDDTARTVSVTNPELKPQYGNNFDLSAEYYFKPQGMVSVGVFRKKISDYIYTGQQPDRGHRNGQRLRWRLCRVPADDIGQRRLRRDRGRRAQLPTATGFSSRLDARVSGCMPTTPT